ncbi:MAG: GNAT family N-acetyltransferase [Anaerolineales bacterium]|nr:GNAT family N-acetyltransferase [Anaerolineales bacterium]
MAGFNGRPDERGEAEIGYGIDEAFRGKGYKTGVIKRMTAWVYADPSCRAVVARGVEKSNAASRRVLAKAGFRPYEETKNSLSYRVRREDVPSAGRDRAEAEP